LTIYFKGDIYLLVDLFQYVYFFFSENVSGQGNFTPVTREVVVAGASIYAASINDQVCYIDFLVAFLFLFLVEFFFQLKLV
jgi:hypothetical protein